MRVPKRLDDAGRASVEAIRAQADDLLGRLDELGLVEAAALLATAIDAIDASLKRLPAGHPAANGQPE